MLKLLAILSCRADRSPFVPRAATIISLGSMKSAWKSDMVTRVLETTTFVMNAVLGRTQMSPLQEHVSAVHKEPFKPCRENGGAFPVTILTGTKMSENGTAIRQRKR